MVGTNATLNGALLAVALTALVATSAHAQSSDAAPRHRLVYRNLVAARANPVGVVDDFAIGYRYRLFDSASILLRDSHVSLLATPKLTPAYAIAGATLEVQPVAVLIAKAAYHHWWYFGSFGQLQSFDSAQADWRDAARERRADAGVGYATRGHQLTLEATLQAKVAGLIVRDQVVIDWFRMQLAAGDRVFYSSMHDALVPADGAVLTNNLDSGWLFARGLLVGARYTFTHVPYTASESGRGRSSSFASHRVGPLLAYAWGGDASRLFQAPTLILILNTWVTHPYRTGVETSRLVPYAVIALAMGGDVL